MNAPDLDRRRIALLDACTLIPIRLTTTLLWLAEAGLFEVLWSDPILAEVERKPAECHAKDRHVLAAAVRGGADTLLTFNVKDFPLTSTDRYGIEVAHPDRFLTRLLSERADDVIAALEFGMTEMTRPPQTMRGFLTSLATTVPTFADLATGRLQ